MKRPGGFDPTPPEVGSAASGTTKGPRRTETAAAEAREAAKIARRASRERRTYERAEVRRFTRLSRRRRAVVGVVSGIVVVFGTLLAVAVWSPLLALKTVEITGTARLDAAAVHDAVDDQLDTPLALLDYSLITRQLSSFPLVRSFATEVKPPSTLVIHILERQPIGALADGDGFTLVDPAGVVIERSAERPGGIPLIDIAGAGADSEAFQAAVEVLLAVPGAVLDRLDTISAISRDNVRLTLRDTGGVVVWGSADDSAVKARVLDAALANFPDVAEYNVSAPGQFTYR